MKFHNINFSKKPNTTTNPLRIRNEKSDFHSSKKKIEDYAKEIKINKSQKDAFSPKSSEINDFKDFTERNFYFNKQVSDSFIEKKEKELEDLKKLFEKKEKQHNIEITRLKLLLNNSIISSDSEIPNENETSKIHKSSSQCLEDLKNENEELNQAKRDVTDEINYLHADKEAKKKIKDNIKRHAESNFLIKKSEIIEKMNGLKFSIMQLKMNSNEEIDLLSIEERERKMEIIERLTKRNNELEAELEEWKLKFWNLEKKQQFDSLMEVKEGYSEAHFQTLIKQEESEELRKDNELKQKLEELKKEYARLLNCKKEECKPKKSAFKFFKYK